LLYIANHRIEERSIPNYNVMILLGHDYETLLREHKRFNRNSCELQLKRKNKYNDNLLLDT
jgi:hypothetical protein